MCKFCTNFVLPHNPRESEVPTPEISTTYLAPARSKQAPFAATLQLNVWFVVFTVTTCPVALQTIAPVGFADAGPPTRATSQSVANSSTTIRRKLVGEWPIPPPPAPPPGVAARAQASLARQFVACRVSPA